MQAKTQSLTKNQSMVLEALKSTEGPLSAYAILDQLREHGFRAPLQVYRALDKLTEAGLVHKLESKNAFIACCFEGNHSCEHSNCSSNHAVAFAICEKCDSVDEIFEHHLLADLEKQTGKDGFQITKTTLELRGLCKDCCDI